MWIETENGDIYNTSRALAVRAEDNTNFPSAFDVTLVFNEVQPATNGIDLTKRPVSREVARRIIRHIRDAIVEERKLINMAEVIKLSSDQVKDEREIAAGQSD